MAQVNTNEIVYLGKNNHYYTYDEELYTVTFPEDWARSHLPKTGPKNCRNCAFYGSWNGVFIGYCLNCAINKYNGYRGRGFVDLGLETCDNVNVKGAFDTYLQGVELKDIGDTDIVDSAGMLKDRLKDLYYDTNSRYESRTKDERYGSHFDGGYDSY
jgi:hypothetical protein